MDTQPTPRTYEQWKAYFRPEGEAHLEELRRLGYHVSQPASVIDHYCANAACRAVLNGKGEIDFTRAREIAERMAGVRPEAERIAA